MKLFLPLLLSCWFVSSVSGANPLPARFEAPQSWEYSAPLISPEVREINPSRAQKDPSVVMSVPLIRVDS